MKFYTALLAVLAPSALAGQPWSGSGHNGPWSGSNSSWPQGGPPARPSGYAGLNLEVQAPSGTYRGLINGTAPQVRQFLGIPFAQPPTGPLRFLPPQPVANDSSLIYDATHFPPSCPQWVTPIPNIFNQEVPEFLINPDHISEDCLALSIWTPTTTAQPLPVIIFITGGGFTTGGVDIQYQLPHNWVQRTQAHIVVTINYRVNIFGFPNAEGLEDLNLGILDQRMAVEWVRDNIAAFGGDPSKITLWGQSAGGSSVDYHNFAFYTDPIVKGFYAQSGSVGLGINAAVGDHSNFTTVAHALHCTSSNPTERLDCMRSVSWQSIISIVGPGTDNYSLGFYPVADDKIIFHNYTQRYIAGQLSRIPAIFSTAANEGNVVVPFAVSGVNASLADFYTDSYFLCPATMAAHYRSLAGVKTYRSLYAGNFSNISPLPWMGSYHDSDLPMFFGTFDDFRGEGGVFEREVSERMQDFLLGFMRDPEEVVGWPEVESGDMLVFGREGDVVEEVSLGSVQGVCEQSNSMRKRDLREVPRIW